VTMSAARDALTSGAIGFTFTNPPRVPG
jgi:hypothetical protein